ncbi:PREDICTED: interferon-induced transmembrane protein 1-like [Poecilia mexicana]|uniref:Interferon-induced transmembrane protein 1-like n=1 Tax=Poecilia formosa TaxID=48698 RepID=A0A087Y722_POEFO|nr:PREDICTED: interferon-induced transmembrane protein 1-like [Poecilia formosa]XP_014869143.1 PREDICTED: interferon-induced transmembrane protein 1-like [Poecilia mexicana]
MHPVYANEPYPGHPGDPGGVQHTVVNVPIEPTKDYLVWSLCSFVYANFCCLGLGALIYSVRARDRKALGDQNGAQRHASSARIFNIVAVVLTSLTVFIYVVVVIAVSERRYNN